MLVSTPNGDILEMNVIVRFKRGKRVYSCSVRRGGHIQSIVGTECATSALAEILLEDLAKDLKSGKWVLGTKNARPCLKREDIFYTPKLHKHPLVSA
jgi:hypothetical protein